MTWWEKLQGTALLKVKHVMFSSDIQEHIRNKMRQTALQRTAVRLKVK